MTIYEAERELQLAASMNPGPWVAHSQSVAENARLIAAHAKDMNPELAYVMGMMHDIGRRAGVTGIRHIFDGYDYMIKLGEENIARVCLTHSFPMQSAQCFFGKVDCTREQFLFLEKYLECAVYDSYDRLIQLCDAISLPEGACIMEKRLVDVALRHGIPEGALEKWRAFMGTKTYFDKLCGCNIYTLLPNVLENSSINLV